MAVRQQFLVWLCCVIIYGLTAMPLGSGQEWCNETFNYEKCQYDIYCKKFFETQHGWDFYRQASGYHSYECTSEVFYSGYKIYPFNLVYEDSLKNEEVPYFISNYQDQINMIISLDLSKNNYRQFPVLATMSNLICLNLSNNLIDVAHFANRENLPLLKEIDLSHNTITHVAIHTDNYPFRELERINLSYNKLENISEAVFDLFTKLTNLDISHNFISSLSANTFEGIKKLVHLNMSFNRITDINASLFRFRALQWLDLSNNLLVNVSGKDLSTLTGLTHLNLESNFINSADDTTFMNLHNLNSLNLNNNGMELLVRGTFKSTDELKEILIARNKFETLPKSLFKGKRIESFSIIGNKLKGPLVRGIFEGLLVDVLDLSNQKIDAIEDIAFFGLGPLKILLLQNNNINKLFPQCFNMLNNLKELDLSYNKIANIEFEKQSLGNLESLSLRNNYLIAVKHEHFKGLDSLQVLDLSDNKISWLESNSFKSLKNLINFEISNNPLNGTLEENTFEGLNSLPSLDISCTLLKTIHNGSFNGMVQLKNLNMSHSDVNLLQFNSFFHTGAVEILDLSHNRLKNFAINNTQIASLNILYLNNNLIKAIDLPTFVHMLGLTKIFISFNEIENINIQSFTDQKNLQVLDVSYNSKLNFDMALINSTSYLTSLHLSGIKSGMSFEKIGHVPLSCITISNASIVDVQALHLNNLNYLDKLQLSHNKITQVDVGNFANVNVLRTLDLSTNKITHIQPGAFKDNTMLALLNVSHNYLKSVNYGIFRGLINLQTLDISYNYIDSLENERFYELRSLEILKADHNKIKTFNSEEFLGTRLSILSIGDNPIPCSQLVNFHRTPAFFEITAIKLDENNNENVDGIICNKNNNLPIPVLGAPVTDNSDITSILVNIRDILNKPIVNNQEFIQNKNEDYLANLTSKLNELRTNNEHLFSNLTSLISQITNKNDTNTLLEKILKVLTINSLKRPTSPTPLTKTNATYDSLLTYIDKLKQQLEDTIAFEKSNILNEVDSKLSDIPQATPKLVHEKLYSGNSSEKPDSGSKSVFTETCVGLILCILVCFVMYKFYKSRVLLRSRLSISTRELPNSMDSPL